MSLGWLGGHHNKQNANYPISDKTLEQEPPFLPASMNNSNMAHPKWGFACSARGSGSSPVIRGHGEWDVIRDLWARDAPGTLEGSSAGIRLEGHPNPSCCGLEWDPGKEHSSSGACVCALGHRDVTCSRQVLLTAPPGTFKGMSSLSSAFPASHLPLEIHLDIAWHLLLPEHLLSLP